MLLTLAHKAGLKTAIITGRTSNIVSKRSEGLKIGDILQGVCDKTTAMHNILAKYNLNYQEVYYVGDDLSDLPVMQQVGFACAVANAVAEVKAAAHFISSAKGGQGAIREILEYIIKYQKLWDKTLMEYLNCGRCTETRQ